MTERDPKSFRILRGQWNQPTDRDAARLLVVTDDGRHATVELGADEVPARDGALVDAVRRRMPLAWRGAEFVPPVLYDGDAYSGDAKLRVELPPPG